MSALVVAAALAMPMRAGASEVVAPLDPSDAPRDPAEQPSAPGEAAASDAVPESSGPRMETIDGSEDELELAGGGIVRGRITEITPGVGVAIIAAGRDAPRDVAWAEIVAIRRAAGDSGSAANRASAAATPAAQPDASTAELGVRIDLRVQGGREVALAELVGESESIVCWSPCAGRVSLNPNAGYVVKGDRIRTSEMFRIPARDAVTLEVRPRSKALLPIGIVAVAVGGVMVLNGLSLLAFSARGPSDSEFPEAISDRRRYRIAGGVLVGAGIGPLVAGIVMLALRRTRVKVAPG